MPSIRHSLGFFFRSLTLGFVEAVLRHPLVMSCGLAGALVGIAFIHDLLPKMLTETQARLLVSALWLGIPLSLAADLLNRRIGSIFMRLSPMLLIALAAWRLQTLGEANAYLHLTLWMVVAHCLVAVAPFLSIPRRSENSTDDEAVRSFNLNLLERATNAFIFTHLLFGGVALALAASRYLLKFDVGERVYFDLWVLSVGIFQTAYFTHGIPAAGEEGRLRLLHPALQFLPRFILIPLTALYLAILYAYAVRILVTAEWPQGWASSLIMVCAGLMLLTLLLLDKDGPAATRLHHARLTRMAFGSLAPLLILLFLAIGKRISDYGITEKRYIVLAAALWLAAMTLLHLMKGRTMVKTIPLSLGFMALIITFGPWGMLSLTLSSQHSRLIEALNRAGALENGKLRKAAQPVDEYLEADISEHLRWFDRQGHQKVLQPLLAPSQWKSTEDFMTQAGLEMRFLSAYSRDANEAFRSISRHYRTKPRHSSVSIDGFTHAARIEFLHGYGDTLMLNTPDSFPKLGLLRSGTPPKWTLMLLTHPSAIPDTLNFDFTRLAMTLDSLRKEGVAEDAMPTSVMRYDTVALGYRWRWYFSNVEVSRRRGDSLPRTESIGPGFLLWAPHVTAQYPFQR